VVVVSRDTDGKTIKCIGDCEEWAVLVAVDLKHKATLGSLPTEKNGFGQR
jgi:hypothetical protein